MRTTWHFPSPPGGPMSRQGVRSVPLAVALVAAGAFATVAQVLARYDAVAIWAGAIWVFLLTTVVALPALTERLSRSSEITGLERDAGTEDG